MKKRVLIILVCISGMIIFSIKGLDSYVQFVPKSEAQQPFKLTTPQEMDAKISAPPASEPAATEETDEGVDVLSIVELMNSGPKPGTDFRAGSVSSANIKDYLTKTSNGFIIKMPASTNIPTVGFHDGKLYVSGGFGSRQYYAFDGQSGTNIWAVNLDDDGPSSCVIQDGVVVFNTESCTIFACDMATGKQLWSHWLGDPLMCMPTAANGKVFTAYPSPLNSSFSKSIDQNNQKKTFRATHVLACFDLKTGKTLWQKWLDGDVMSAPVSEGNALYVTTFPGTVYKFDQASGKVLSAKYIRATSAPVIHDSEMTVSRRAEADSGEYYEEIVRSLPGVSTRTYMQKKADYLDKSVQQESDLKTLSMDMDAGNGFAGGAPSSSGAYEAADNIGQSNVSSLQSFQGSRVAFFNSKSYNTMGDEIICSEPESGKVVWKAKLDGDMKKSGGFLGTPPVMVGGYAVVATFSGDVMVINASSGKVEEKYDTKSNIRYQPVVVNGWIYVTTTDGRLVAINTNNPKLNGWPMWGGNAAHSNKAL